MVVKTVEAVSSGLRVRRSAWYFRRVRRFHSFPYIVLGAVLSGSVGCSGPLALRADPKTAKGLYEQSREDLESGYYPEALKGFNAVKTKFPYSKYAALADLGIADTHFEQGKLIEAVDAYRQFLRLHPNHRKSDYAMLRIGESYYEQMPQDWFFMPPSEEKDQKNTRLAITAYRNMLSRYPNSELADKAREHLQKCQRELARHELYVAKFYFERGKYPGAAYRAERLLQKYGGLGLDSKALWLAARARRRMGENDRARRHLRALVSDHAASEQAKPAEQLLSTLGRKSSTVTDS